MLSITSNQPECYLIGLLALVFLGYVFIKHKPLCLVMVIISVLIISLFGVKVLIYNNAKLDLNKKVIVKEIENKDDYQKVIVSDGTLKYLYYNKEISNKIHVGDIYYIRGSVEKKQEENTPNGFDYATYLKYQNIIGVINAQEITYVKNIFTLSKVNAYLEQYYDNNFKHANIIKALVIGNKNSIDEQLMSNIQAIGISHLFVVSGLHVGMLTSMLGFVLNKTKMPKKLVNLIIYLFLGLYLIITNFMVSVMRVTLAYVLKDIIKKDVTPLDKISINMIIVLLINPFYLFSYSYILTYLISSMIIIISPLLFKKKGFIYYLANMIIISIASIIVTLPVVVNINPNINLLSVLYNIIYIPFVSYVLLPLSIIISVLPWLENIFSFIYTYFILSINFLSKLNFLTFSFPVLNNMLCLSYYVVIFISVYLFERRKWFFSLFYITYLFCWYNKAYIDIYDKVVFLDVAEGDATHIKTNFNQTNIIIDTGIDTDDSIILYLKKEGIRKIDLVIISHGDSDHNGNLDKLINNFDVQSVILSCYDYQTYQILKDNNFNNYYLVKGKDEFVIKDIAFKVLWPTSDAGDVNNNSLVFTMDFENTTFLFTGDIEKKAEEKIIDIYKQLDVDVLKIAHHASNTSTHQKWLENVNFKVGIVMTGDKNTFGFPNQYTVDRLKNYEVYYTSNEDTITFLKVFFKKKWQIDTLRKK